MQKNTPLVGEPPTADAPLRRVPPTRVWLRSDNQISFTRVDPSDREVDLDALIMEDAQRMVAMLQQLRAQPQSWDDTPFQDGWLTTTGHTDKIRLHVYGYEDGMQRVGLPPNHGQTQDAAHSMCAAAPDLQRVAPAALSGVNVERLRVDLTWSHFLDRAQQQTTSFAHGLAVLSSQTTLSMHGRLRQVWRHVSVVVGDYFDLGQRLRPMRELFQSAAEQAQETRAKLEKARKQATDKASGEPPAAPQTTPTHPTPRPISDK